MALAALAVLLLSIPASADRPAPAPAERQFVDPEILRTRAESLRDAVADMSVSDIALKSQAHGFFDKLPEERLVLAVVPRRMDREDVSGELGTIKGMQATADERIAEWRRAHIEPPPPELMQSVEEAKVLQSGKRLDYDRDGRLAANQMGVFQYLRERRDAGLVTLNERMTILGAFVGEAFTYATVAHEAHHSLDHAAGRLTPEQEIAGEVSAFRVQYLWLSLMDPRGERLMILHGSLYKWMLRERDPDIRAALTEAVQYLTHLSDVTATGGDKDKLEKLVKKLGYSDGPKHDHGHESGRVSASPTSA